MLYCNSILQLNPPGVNAGLGKVLANILIFCPANSVFFSSPLIALRVYDFSLLFDFERTTRAQEHYTTRLTRPLLMPLYPKLFTEAHLRSKQIFVSFESWRRSLVKVGAS